MGGGPAVRDHIDRRDVDVVVLVFRRLFFQSVDKNLEISLGDAADELIRRRVIKINHCMLHGSSLSQGPSDGGRRALVPVLCRLLERVRELEHAPFVAVTTDDLHPYG